VERKVSLFSTYQLKNFLSLQEKEELCVELHCIPFSTLTRSLLLRLTKGIKISFEMQSFTFRNVFHIGLFPAKPFGTYIIRTVGSITIYTSHR